MKITNQWYYTIVLILNKEVILSPQTDSLLLLRSFRIYLGTYTRCQDGGLYR